MSKCEICGKGVNFFTEKFIEVGKYGEGAIPDYIKACKKRESERERKKDHQIALATIKSGRILERDKDC